MNATTWSVFRRNESLRALVTSRLVSSAGTWLAYVALTVDVYAHTHSSTWVSAVLLAVIAVLGPKDAWLAAAALMGVAALSSLQQPKAAKARRPTAELA